MPGVIVVIMAYINEEFAATAMLAGPCRRTFRARCWEGFSDAIFRDWSRISSRWRHAFLVIGLINLAGAIIVQRSLPGRRTLCVPPTCGHSLSETLLHLRNPRLLAVFGMGFSALFCLVGAFTYANFYLADPPFRLNSEQLGSVFFVYLFWASS